MRGGVIVVAISIDRWIVLAQQVGGTQSWSAIQSGLCNSILAASPLNLIILPLSLISKTKSLTAFSLFFCPVLSKKSEKMALSDFICQVQVTVRESYVSRPQLPCPLLHHTVLEAPFNAP